jgi:hypothetical protein
MDAVTMNKLNEVHNCQVAAQAMRGQNECVAGARVQNLSLGHRLARAGGNFVLTAWHWAVTNSKRAGSVYDSYREPVNNGFRKVII